MLKSVEIGRQRNVVLDPLLQETLTRVGGTNPYGAPRYRICWGQDRTEWVCGKWPDGFIGYRELPKYEPADRYHLELWFPPEHYGGLETWKRDNGKVINGVAYEPIEPYPSKGEYEHLWTVQTPEDKDGKRHFLRPNHDMMLHVVQVHRKSMNRTRWDIARGIQEREAASRKEYESKRDAILGEAADRFVTQAIKGRTVKELKDEMEALAPANHARPSIAAFRRVHAR